MIIPTLAIHGGAGTIRRDRMSTEKEATYQQALHDALKVGGNLLAAGATALDAAEATVRWLEDCPLFNAGRGAVFAHDGTHRFDASIMRGDTLQAGAIAHVRGLRNPISLARRVMEASRYVMMVGEGAEAFAREQGLPFESDAYFFVQLRYEQWQRVKDSQQTLLDHSDKGERNFSTVGAVALDQQGHLAAATSTGGMTNKRYGRVGDSPIIGAGTYADDRYAAVCCTGHGEPFMRGLVAYDVIARMQYLGQDLATAAGEVIHGKMVEMQGEGGLIALDREGRVSLTFNCLGMYRGQWSLDGEPQVAIFS
jgi:beta-aspartyl-peptidase (threonine type)